MTYSYLVFDVENVLEVLSVAEGSSCRGLYVETNIQKAQSKQSKIQEALSSGYRWTRTEKFAYTDPGSKRQYAIFEKQDTTPYQLTPYLWVVESNSANENRFTVETNYGDGGSITVHESEELACRTACGIAARDIVEMYTDLTLGGEELAEKAKLVSPISAQQTWKEYWAYLTEEAARMDVLYGGNAYGIYIWDIALTTSQNHTIHKA